MVKRICLVCGYNDTTHESKEEYKEIIPCPKCHGSFVDEWVSEGYKPIDGKETILPHTTSIKDKTDLNILCGRHQLNKWASQQKEQADNAPLLTIELQDESSVPKVIYKGKEIKQKKEIQFEWDTLTAAYDGGLTYMIEHYEKQYDNSYVMNRLERRTKDHL